MTLEFVLYPLSFSLNNKFCFCEEGKPLALVMNAQLAEFTPTTQAEPAALNEHEPTHAQPAAQDLFLNVVNNELLIDYESFRKMHFIYNALETGWAVKKNTDLGYVFTQKHNSEGQVDISLEEFIHTNLYANGQFNANGHAHANANGHANANANGHAK